jgi:PAS domain S-box-containing protein
MERSERSAALRLALADAIGIVADAVIMLDENLCILCFNKGAERIFGYSSPEILNQSLDVLLPSRFVIAHHNHLPAFAATLQAVRLMGDPLQVRGRRKDGSEFPAEVSLSKLVKDEHTTFTVIVRDVTDRLGADEALRRWLHIFDHVEWGVVIDSADGRALERVNPAFARMHGYAAEELVGSPITQVYAPESQSELPGQIRLAHEKGHHTFESKHIRKDGTVFPVSVDVTAVKDEAGRVLHRVVSVQDITERKRVEETFRESEERYRSMVAAMQEGIVFQDADVASTLELRPLMRLILEQLSSVVNYTSAAIFTLEDEELVILEYQVPTLGRPALPLRLPLEEAGLGQQVIRNREPIIVDDVQGDIPLARAVQRSGRADVKTIFSYAHSWMAIPLIAKDKVIGMLGLAYEEPGYYTTQHARLVLTVANQAAVALEKARLYEQARQLSALEERQRLARELHDSVSQALYSIALGARTARTWLERDPAKAAEPLDYVRSLAEAGLAEMRALIFELRPESLQNEGLAAALTKQTDALRARHGIDVQVSLCDEPSMSMEVREALYRIAQESLHNTIKHARASRVDVALSCSEAAIILQVADNGLGFDTAEPFPGHLGLRSMRERAERVGGTFEVNSSLGSGTRIRVQILSPPASLFGLS